MCDRRKKMVGIREVGTRNSCAPRFFLLVCIFLLPLLDKLSDLCPLFANLDIGLIQPQLTAFPRSVTGERLNLFSQWQFKPPREVLSVLSLLWSGVCAWTSHPRPGPRCNRIRAITKKKHWGGIWGCSPKCKVLISAEERRDVEANHRFLLHCRHHGIVQLCDFG